MSAARTTLVLVHGAWHGPWCWDLLREQLELQNLEVQCPALPSAGDEPAGLAQDARHLGELVSRISGPVVLVGHSYGGMVISATDTARNDIRRLVYLCAYMTLAGESVDSSLRLAGERRPGHWIRHLPDGRTRVDAGRAAAHFYADCPSATQDWAISRLRPHWGQVLTQSVCAPAWQRHASTYVVCAEDRALSPQLQRDLYASRAQQVVTLSSGHSPFLSQPAQLARVLVSIVQ